MSWLLRHRLRRFAKYSFWLFPSLAIVAAWVYGRVVTYYIPDIDIRAIDENNIEGSRAVIAALAASMMTFVVYAVSALLLAVQLASGQITPRLIALTFGRSSMKACTSAFVFAFGLSVIALGNVSSPMRSNLLLFSAVLADMGSIIAFFWFVQGVGTSLRPVAVLQYLFDAGKQAMDSVYDGPFEADARPAEPLPPPSTGRTVVRRGTSGSFLAFGMRDLVAAATRAGCVIEIVPQVGDFVSVGDPVARIYPPTAAIGEALINDTMAFGAERTMEQDPMFAFRIMVDIGARALSPAINDPTTAVLALDQIHRLLRYAGFLNIDTGRVHDGAGNLRLVYPTPNWEDIVDLALVELRQYGSTSIQVARRMKALLEHLIDRLPAERAGALRRELAALENGAARAFIETEDRRRASFGDFQGLGGAAARTDEL
jgi:uncharacterized membrane protein